MGPRIVPIVADEARTFGMANLFRQIGIYSAQGQLYEPEDIGSVLYYREARDGQILEEGITEAGAISSWTAAGTSYSVNGLPMLPFYIYYSMFGFQRIGDLIWAAADQRTRGFLVGATSGRTTLGGEGLQHQDGSSHLTAATVPNCRAYDPAYAYEVAVIVEYGMRRMLDEQHDEFFYLTVTNENLAQPDMPADPAARAGILRGLPAAPGARPGPGAPARLGPDAARGRTGGRPPARRIRRGRRSLERDQLFRTGARRPRSRARPPPGLPATPDADGSGLPGRQPGPVIAASDYVRAVPEQIRAWVPARPTARWAPTVSAAATRGRNCATSSRSAATGSCCKRWTAWDAADVQAARAAGQRARRRPGRSETRGGGRAIAAWPPPRRPFPTDLFPDPGPPSDLSQAGIPALVVPIPFAARPQPEPRISRRDHAPA